MFDWDTPKELNEQDIVTLLTSKLSMRLNMERKRIEHATLVSGTKEIEEPESKKPKHLPLSPNTSLAPNISLYLNTSLPPNTSLPLNVPRLQIPATNTSLQTAYPPHTANINSIPGLPPTDTCLQIVSTQDTINIHSLQDPPPIDSSLQTAYTQDPINMQDITPGGTSLQTACSQDTINIHSLQDHPPTDTNLQSAHPQDSTSIQSMQDLASGDASLQTAYLPCLQDTTNIKGNENVQDDAKVTNDEFQQMIIDPDNVLA